MRLLHVLPTFGIGGTELRVASLINGLGPDLSHFILPLNGATAAYAMLTHPKQAEIVPPPNRNGSLNYFLGLRRVLKSLSPELLLTYNWGSIDAVIAARLGNVCPVILNECGFGIDEAVHLNPKRMLTRRVLLNTIHTTIVVSSVLRDVALNRYRIRPDKVRLIRTGVDTQRFSPRPNPELRARLSLPEGYLVFGYVGGLRPEKHPQFLMKAYAAARIPHSRLLLVGDGQERTSLQHLAGDLAIENETVFAGMVSDTSPYFGAIDVFLMSSATEQTPNALLEAMAAGLPAVCTDVGDIAEILDCRSVPVIVKAGDLQGYVRALKSLAASPSVRQQLGKTNRHRCLLNYSQERMVQEYREAYFSALCPSGDPVTALL